MIEYILLVSRQGLHKLLSTNQAAHPMLMHNNYMPLRSTRMLNDAAAATSRKSTPGEMVYNVATESKGEDCEGRDAARACSAYADV